MNPQQITLTCANPPLTVAALRGQVAPRPEDFDAGWTNIARPRRTALTQWDGADPRGVVFSMLIDGVGDNHSIEPDCDQLEQMAQPAAKGSEPPIIRAVGALPHTELDWIIGRLEWDPDPIYSRALQARTRQEVTVHLLEYVADDRLAAAPAAERARRKAAQQAAAAAKSAGTSPAKVTKDKIYVVHAGDSLSSIAARVLGSYKRWPELATLNGLRDPNRLTVGRRLRLP